MLTKADLFPDTLASLAEQAKALSHPARLAIIEHLAARDTCLCGDLVDTLPLAQATVSQHLKVLKAAGLVKGEVDGPRSCYCLDRDALAGLHEALQAFFHGALAEAPACIPDPDCC
ncbi:MAG: metalloregulator ArsR/SmtB family transcription factor [Gemmatimonadota bacterium]